MTNSIATIGKVQSEELIASQVASSPLANIWLGFLLAVLGVTFFSTAVLVAWPVVVHMITG